MPDIIDWPTSRAFAAAQVTFGLSVAEQAVTGFYTGTRMRTSAMSERMQCVVTLPPCGRSEAAEREAFLLALRSGGLWLRMAPPHRGRSAANSAVASVATIAGARSLALSGIAAAPNLLACGGLENDTDVDGYADGVIDYSAGTVGTRTPTLVAGNGSTWAQRVAFASLGSSSGDRAGISFVQFGQVTQGSTYSLGVDTKSSTTSMAAVISLEWYDASIAAELSEDVQSQTATTGWTRRTLTATAPSGAGWVGVVMWAAGNGTSLGANSIDFDNIQLEAGYPTTFSGLPTIRPGDFLSYGQNTLGMVAYPGATVSAAGTATVPLATGAPAAIASGSVVQFSGASGLWELDSDIVQFGYLSSAVQDGIAVPLRQVVIS